MTRRLRSYLLGGLAIGALGLLAGCGGHHFFAEREPWRHEAELQCMNAGAVKESPGKVRISPIDGPGMCGMDFPMKVSSLGDSVPLAFSDEPRPPAAVPGAGQTPRWPIAQPVPAGAVTRDDLPAPDAAPDDRGQPRRGPPANGSRLLSDQPLALEPSRGPIARAIRFPQALCGGRSAGRRCPATRARRKLAL